MNGAWSLVLTVLGLLLTSLSMLETWMAVLYPRAVTGPVTAATYRVYHHVSQKLLGPKNSLLRFSGPVLIVSQAAVWASLLLFGVSLIVWPQLGTGIVSSDGGVTDKDFGVAIYYAGFSVTTLGTGDLVPQSTFTRTVTITAAAVGFSFFTLVLAYIISVYSALGRRNQFASEIDYRTGRTGDTLVYLTSYLRPDDRSILHQDLLTLASGLADVLESHHFYPALHYFRFSEPRYAMSRMLRFCLEVSSAVRALNHVQSDSENPEPAERLWHASLQTLEDAMKHFVICRASPDEIDVTLAQGVAEQMHSCEGDTGFEEEAFVSDYQESCKHWSDDLESLERCTMTGSYVHPCGH